MISTSDQVFEFHDLDALWDRVKDLKSHLEVRRPGQGAQGAIDEIGHDARFKDFTTRGGKYNRQFDPIDLTVFTIYRTPNRRR
ncbi:MAG TPA: hypothetical protein VGQ99_00860 [Tepidisphaeraceae bacterium]|jgi:hypothetical protein|nr:hypothetical protein [Tepidisphaeraceae bacterium]